MLAIELHGALGGSWLAAKRLLRCHPLGGSGYDPVPMLSVSSRETCQAHENENAAGGVLVCSKDH
jgi:putative component of membrane protein insertase Oxa1/YidC/SpoIIIJ protein YidD